MLLISKAAAPKPGPGPEDPVSAERAVGEIIYRALRRIVRELPTSVLETLDAQKIAGAVPWDVVGERLMAVAKPLEKVITDGARDVIPREQLAKAALPIDGEPFPVEFALINELAVKFAAAHAGSLVIELSTKMRDTITRIVTGAVAGQLPPAAVVRLLRAVLPLHTAWAETVERVFQHEYLRQLEAGTTLVLAQEAAGRAAEVRAERLVQARSRNIARTEVMRAMNEGKFTGWSEQVGQGWMPVDSLKEWVEGRSPCKLCQPLVGEIVMWDQPFSNGQMMPPEHPSCRCTAALLPPDEDIVARMRRQQVERGY